MRKIPMSLVVCMLVMSMISSVSAMTISGDPIEGDSWWQGFIESGVGAFDTVETFMGTPGVDFEAPGFKNFSVGSWSGGLINPDYALGTGADVTSLTWYIGFTSDKPTPFYFDFFAWDDGTLKEAARASWSGSSWSFSTLDSDGSGYDRSAVPIPTAMLLLGSGLFGLVGIRRKFRRS